MAIYLNGEIIGINTVHQVSSGGGSETPQQSGTVISDTQMDELQEAVNWRTGQFGNHTISSMIDTLKQNYFVTLSTQVNIVGYTTSWVRPQEWPDLDSLNLQMEGDDFIYMTYDNTQQPSAVGLHIEAISKGRAINVTVGHIENGTYVVDETITGTSNNYIKWFSNTDDQYPVVRVTGDIRCCYAYSISNNGMTQHYIKQPILERIAYVPHIAYLCSNINTQAWGTLSLAREVINNGDGSNFTLLYGAWYKCRNLESLDITGLKTQNVTDMRYAFSQIYIDRLDLSHFNVKKVTNMSSMFASSRCLKVIDCSGWETDALTNLQSTFDNCQSLETIIGIENFNTTKLTTLYNAFIYCHSLLELDVSKWQTPALTSMYQTFYDCRNLKILDLHNWTLDHVTNFAGTFYGCSSLKQLNLDNLISGIVTSMGNTFAYCRSLETINLAPFQVTSACTSINGCFSNCWSLKELHFPHWDVSGLGSGSNTGNSIFNNCYSLETITGISDWKFSFTNSLSSIFYNCYSLKNLDVKNWTVNATTNLSSIFYCCWSLEELDLSNWIISSNCTNISSMFAYCYCLKSITCDFNQWDTSKVTTFATMFRDCRSLTDFPNISNWDFSAATTISDIFYSCYSLTRVVWTNVSLPKCTTMTTLFRYCYNLEYVDLSGWDTPMVTNNTSYYHTLGSCWKLRTVIGFPIPSTYTNIGFQDCEDLSHDTVIHILELLPSTTAGHTIRFPTLIINSLTADEKLIATNKHWTIST